MTERSVDEYGRRSYEADEIPPPDEQFARWRGRITHPTASATVSAADHARQCAGGWLASGDWWLHCGTCRPERRSFVPERHA